MRWVKYHHEKVAVSIDIYCIHGYGRSMGTMQHVRI